MNLQDIATKLDRVADSMCIDLDHAIACRNAAFLVRSLAIGVIPDEGDEPAHFADANRILDAVNYIATEA